VPPPPPPPPERIVLVAPVTSPRSAAAASVRALLPVLGRATRVVLVLEEAGATATASAPPGAEAVMDLASWRRAPLLRALPHAYSLADHADHAYAYRAALEHLGLAVLHDASLHRLVAGLTLGEGAARAYEAAMAAAYGLAGRRLARLRQHGFWSPAQAARLPLHHALLDASRHVVVHHHAAAARLRAGAEEPPPVTVAPCPAAAPPADAETTGKAAARARLGLPGEGQGAVLLAPDGGGAAALRLLAALRTVAPAGPEPNLLLRGEDGADPALAAFAGEHGLTARLRRAPAPRDAAEAALPLRAADALIDLRAPEGAGAVALAEAFAAGLPALAWAGGAAAECPAEAVLMLPPAADMAAPATAVAALLADRERLAAMGRAAEAFMRTGWTAERAAAAWLGALARLG
jgi:hypothetical protein